MFEKPFPPDSWITTGLKGWICQDLKRNLDTNIKFEGKNEMFEPEYECHEVSLLYSTEKIEFSTLVT